MFSSLRQFVLAVLLLIGAAQGVSANEKGAFNSAYAAFADRFYQRAEGEFASFVQTYTNSARLPEAILFQAQARVQLTNYTGAIELLAANFSKAGSWAHEYVFWTAEGYLRTGNLAKAAQEFATVVAQYPGSSRALAAAVGEAGARMRLGEHQKVMELLQQTNGVFQAHARTNQTGELLASGHLLLGEAQAVTGHWAGLEATLSVLSGFQLAPGLAWQRERLQTRLLLGKDKPADALQGLTNLLTLATNSGQKPFIAESIALEAELLERLGRGDQAMEVYQKNLGDGFPAERQKQALLKIAELSLARNRLPKAAQMLETFCVEHRDAASRDLALLTLAELRLRQHMSGETNSVFTIGTNAPVTTNNLQQAMGVLNELVKQFPQSSLLGKAQLDLGWGFWLQDNLAEAQSSFQAAMQNLPPSMDQAVAQFKLADTLFRLKDYAGAITNYDGLIQKFRALPEVKTNLFEPALYQMARAALAAGDIGAATNSLARLLEWYPTGYHADRAVLLTGQEMSRAGQPARAREIFTAFLQAATNAPLAPEVELAVARTYEQENKWDETVAAYDKWLTRFGSSPSAPRAEYGRAWANFRAGRSTNAFTQFTNFVAQFPAHEWAPMAQWWVADYYFSSGRIPDAERQYQLIYQGTNASADMKYQAQMMAGRAAVARQGWRDAINYFTNLTGDIKCPSDIWVQAMFAYGDAIMSRDSTNKVVDYEEAITVFSRITETHPTNQVALLAIGQKANCLLQWAQFTRQYDPATNEFTKLIRSPLAGPTARAIARVGLGVVLEKQAEQKLPAERASTLRDALNQYLDVLYYEKELRENERPDLFWVKKAGLEAARLAESLAEWAQAVRIYARLRELLPALAPTLDKKTIRAEENLARDARK